MPLLALLSAQLLTADPSVAIVISRRVDVKAEVAAKAMTAVEKALAAEQISHVMPSAETNRRLAQQGVKNTAGCEGDRVCLLGVMHVLEVDVLVAIDLGHVIDQYALRLSALDGSAVAPLAERAGLFPERQFASTLESEATQLARELRPRLVARPDPEPTSQAAPVVIVPPAPAAAPSTKGPSLGPVLLVGGGVSGLTSLALAIAGAAQKSSLDGSYHQGSSTFTRTEADALAGRANGLFTVSLLTLLLGAGLTALGAALLFGG
ncbi:MAG: hypothetical protein IPJ65_08405 [Archangiaceae bacterium]|nr:hypothetical protein [Archangiaceae bacterium]